jgi:dephospho-CoA kinase
MKVIGFCGLPGSGKSTAIEAISDLGRVLTMGDVIRNEAINRNLKPSGENLGAIAKELREKEGKEVIAKKCIEIIQNLKEDVVFVDGLRSMNEVNEFRKFWKFPVIAIELDENVRFNRLYRRARSDDPKTLEQLRERDQRELNFGLSQVISQADIKIQNKFPEKEFKEKIRKRINKILQTY